MAYESQVDQLLDDWEELRVSNPELSPEQFANDRLCGAEKVLVEEFIRKAEKLATIDQQMERFAGPLLNEDPLPRRNDDSVELMQSDLRPGLAPIPGYTLVSPLGRGGFGDVWKAESPGGFHVALKFVQIGGRIGEIEQRSLNVIKDVRHPNLLSVFGTWRVGSLLVIATELADRTLLDRLHEVQKEGHPGIAKDELLGYFAEAAKGIDALNDPGKSNRMRIQHRDIKPQNLLLSGGSVKVGDFGLARSLQNDVTGHTGSLTFAYAAPECFDGTTSNRSDQYSLAVTYCQLRGGRLPFEGTQVEVMEGHRKKQPDLSMIPAEERPAVAKALAKLSKDRWKSCAEFVRHLGLPDDAGNSRSAHASKVKTDPSSKRWFSIAVAVIPIVALICWFSKKQHDGAQQPPSDTLQDGQRLEDIQLSAADHEARPRVAVLYFENQSAGQKELDPLAKGLCSMMITRFDAMSEYQIVERDRLEAVLDELRLTRSATFDQREVAQIGNLVGARQLVLGSYFYLLDVFRIDARLIDVETGVTIAAAGVEGSPDDFSNLLSELVEQLIRDKSQPGEVRHVQESVGRVGDGTSCRQISVGSALALGAAVDAYDRGDITTAVATVDAIVKSNPGFEDAKKLRRQWTALPADAEGEQQNEQ